MALRTAIGPARPEGGIEYLAVGGNRLDAGERFGAAYEVDELTPARAFAEQRGNVLVITLGRGAETGDHVHRVAELLQDCVGRDSADLSQRHVPFAGKVALPARNAAAGRIEQTKAEGGHRASICAALEVRDLVVADGPVEIEAQVGATIERVGRCIDVGLVRVQGGDPAERGQRQLGRVEKQVAVAALEADFGLQADAGPREAPASPWT